MAALFVCFQLDFYRLRQICFRFMMALEINSEVICLTKDVQTYDISKYSFVESGSDIVLKKKIPDLEIRYTMEHQTRLRSHLSTPARFALCIPAFYEGGKIGPVAFQIYVITGSEGENANLIVQKTDTGLSLRSMTKAASSG